MPHYIYTKVLTPSDIFEIDMTKLPGQELNKPKFGILKYSAAEVFVEAPNKKTARNIANGLIDEATRGNK